MSSDNRRLLEILFHHLVVQADQDSDTAYGGCTTACKWGAFCGDGHADTGRGEECDLAGVPSTESTAQIYCTEACKIPLLVF